MKYFMVVWVFWCGLNTYSQAQTHHWLIMEESQKPSTVLQQVYQRYFSQQHIAYTRYHPSDALPTQATWISCEPYDERLMQLGRAGYLEDLSTQPWMHRLPAFHLAPFQDKSSGQIFCLPLHVQTYGFFYRKSIFAQLELSPPETFSELIAILRALQAKSHVVPLASITTSNQAIWQSLGPSLWMGDAGRRLWQEQPAVFDSEYQKELFDLNEMLRGFLSVTSTPVIDQFNQGQIAILIGPLAFIDGLDRSDIGLFKPPKWREENACHMLQFPQQGVALLRQAPHKEMGLEFLQWLVSRDYVNVLLEHTMGLLPATQYAIEAQNNTTRQMQRWVNACQPSFPLVDVDAQLQTVRFELPPVQAKQPLLAKPSTENLPKHRAQNSAIHHKPLSDEMLHALAKEAETLVTQDNAKQQQQKGKLLPENPATSQREAQFKSSNMTQGTIPKTTQNHTRMNLPQELENNLSFEANQVIPKSDPFVENDGQLPTLTPETKALAVSGSEQVLSEKTTPTTESLPTSTLQAPTVRDETLPVAETLDMESDITHHPAPKELVPLPHIPSSTPQPSKDTTDNSSDSAPQDPNDQPEHPEATLAQEGL